MDIYDMLRHLLHSPFFWVLILCIAVLIVLNQTSE